MKLYGHHPEGNVNVYLRYRKDLLSTLSQLKVHYASSGVDTDMIRARKKAIAEVSAIVTYLDLNFPVFQGFTVYTPEKSFTLESLQEHIRGADFISDEDEIYINHFFLLENQLYRLNANKILEKVEMPQNFMQAYQALTKHTLVTHQDGFKAEIVSVEDWLKLIPCDPNRYDTYLKDILRVAKRGFVFGESLPGTVVDPIYVELLNLSLRLNVGLQFACQDNPSIPLHEKYAHFFLDPNDSRRFQAFQYDHALHQKNMQTIHDMAKRFVGAEHAWLRQLGKGLLYTAAILLIAAGIVAILPSGGFGLTTAIAGSAVVAGLSGMGMYKRKYHDLAQSIEEIELPNPPKVNSP